MAYIDTDKFNRHPMNHILDFLGYKVYKVGNDTYGEVQREPLENEKKYFKIFIGSDGIYRCYPYTDNQAYTNVRLMDKFVKAQNTTLTVFDFIERKASDLKFNIPKRITIDDLKVYKTKDLKNIVLGLGFKEQKSKSTFKYPVFVGKYPDGEKRILALKRNINGEWVSFDNTAGGKVFDCIKLVKDYYPRFNLTQLNEQLEYYTSNTFETPTQSKEELTYNYLKDGHVNRYMTLRGFDRNIYYETKMFKGLLKTEIMVKGDQEFANQAYMIRDVNTTKFVGYIRRNISLYNGNLKGFSGGKEGLFCTNYKPKLKTTLLFAESVENGISYYQLNQAKLKSGGQVLICATGGTPSNTQKEQFKSLLGQVKVFNCLLLGDNDIGGQKFNYYAIQQLVGTDILSKVQTSEKDQTICITSYDLDLPSKLGKGFEFTEKKGEDSNLKKTVTICLNYNWEEFKKFNEAVIAAYLDKRITIIRSAKDSDFNQDLMNHTGMQQYLDDAKKFGLSDKDLLNDPKKEYMIERNLAIKNVKNLVQDIKANRITAINVVDMVKLEGVKTHGAFTSLLKVVYKGGISTKIEVHKDIEKGKNQSIEQEI